MSSAVSEVGRISARENARLAVEQEDLARSSAARQAANKLWRIVVLSPELGVCEALCRGEKVPVSSLDARWARRFRLR